MTSTTSTTAAVPPVPPWADPAATLTDPTNGEQIHRAVTTRVHGDHEARTVIAAAEGEAPALFVEVLSGEHGLDADQAEALAEQIKNAAAALRQ